MLSWRDVIFVALPSVLLLLLAFWLAANYIKPAPPSRAVISTGSEGGAYQRFGALYADVLEKNGVQLIAQPSAGSPENLQRLRDPDSGVDAAFIQGGTALSKADEETLVSLGELYYEPLWIFIGMALSKILRPCLISKANAWRSVRRAVAHSVWRAKYFPPMGLMS